MTHHNANGQGVNRILILEDNGERRRIMQECLSDRFPQYGVVFFTTAPMMIEYLKQHDRDELLLISLDHDLEPDCDAIADDPGTGRDVADCLAERHAKCPVIIHSTNAPAAVGMQTVLEDSGWTTIRVVPYDAQRWIEETWFRAARNAIVDDAGRHSIVPAEQLH